jgi:hypothetical protein
MAATTVPGPISIGDPPSRSTTAPKPSTRPATTVGASFWRSQAAETIAVNSGVVAISSDASEAGRLSVANASSEKGMAENVAPTTRNATGWRRAAASAERPLTIASTRPAIATRISAVQSGPISGEATRKNRNAAPQTAPR